MTLLANLFLRRQQHEDVFFCYFETFRHVALFWVGLKATKVFGYRTKEGPVTFLKLLGRNQNDFQNSFIEQVSG